MDPIHRYVINSKRDIISKTVSLPKLEPFLKKYRIFNKYMWEDLKTVSDVFEALPSRGPNAYRSIIEILRKAGYNKEADTLEKPSSPNELRNRDLYYEMSSKILGYCLIINNVDFKPSDRLGYRHGSDIDAESLRSFFERIEFNVISEKDMKAGEMMNCIKKFAAQDFTAVDSMVLIILSHGGCEDNQDFIYGTDGNKVLKNNIYEVFSNENCESLQNKPKIFFFIACRGQNFDYGVPKRRRHKVSIDAAKATIMLPTFSDIYICHSSLPYKPSLRHHDNGTFFGEALVSVLNEYHEKYDLDTMISLVNNKLKNKPSKELRMVQIAHSENLGGTKKIMLCRTN